MRDRFMHEREQDEVAQEAYDEYLESDLYKQRRRMKKMKTPVMRFAYWKNPTKAKAQPVRIVHLWKDTAMIAQLNAPDREGFYVSREDIFMPTDPVGLFDKQEETDA